jgi:hypothetical protein
MDGMSWHGTSTEEMFRVWDKVFFSSAEGLNLSAPCPVCGQTDLHMYYDVGRPEEMVFEGVRYVAKGALWTWCSSCYTYEHYNSRVPDWWSCDLALDKSKLTALPSEIERARLAQISELSKKS